MTPATGLHLVAGVVGVALALVAALRHPRPAGAPAPARWPHAVMVAAMAGHLVLPALPGGTAAGIALAPLLWVAAWASVARARAAGDTTLPVGLLAMGTALLLAAASAPADAVPGLAGHGGQGGHGGSGPVDLRVLLVVLTGAWAAAALGAWAHAARRAPRSSLVGHACAGGMAVAMLGTALAAA